MARSGARRNRLGAARYGLRRMNSPLPWPSLLRPTCRVMTVATVATVSAGLKATFPSAQAVVARARTAMILMMWCFKEPPILRPLAKSHHPTFVGCAGGSPYPTKVGYAKRRNPLSWRGGCGTSGCDLFPCYRRSSAARCCCACAGVAPVFESDDSTSEGVTA